MKIIGNQNIGVLICFMLLTGCSFLQSVSLTQIPPERDNVVTATTEKFIILGFNFNNDYLDTLRTDLSKQCPGGQVKGIFTKDESIMYLLAHTRRVTATGYCVK